jgi:hypothetical protein
MDVSGIVSSHPVRIGRARRQGGHQVPMQPGAFAGEFSMLESVAEKSLTGGRQRRRGFRQALKVCAPVPRQRIFIDQVPERKRVHTRPRPLTA